MAEAKPKKASRLLAALDDSNTTPSPTLPNALKRPLDSQSPYGNNKRHASGSTAPTANYQTGASAHNILADMEFLQAATQSRAGSSLPSSSAVGGFSLRYDNESPLTRLDFGGKDQDVQMAQFVTRTLDNDSHGLSVKDSLKRLNLRDLHDLIPGMEVRLLPHQVIGVSWMTHQERNTKDKGGILADEMGLGKTVQMIATMVVNQPPDDETNRTTLIVVPAALLLQWKEEIESKTNGIFNVHIHHGKFKLKKQREFENYDIIITTYQTLNLDFNVPNGTGEDEEEEWVRENGGVLSRIKWYRVIADEAQFIRNRGTRSSKAVAMLRASYRWSLTGTPIANTLADIFGLLRFGHFRPWNDWPDFNDYIAKTQLEDAPLAGMRAQQVLRPLMLRRTKDADLEGQPLLRLPPKDIELVLVDFSDEERSLYETFEKRAQVHLRDYFKNNTHVKNHTAVLVMILRLRQLCCHPHLILSENTFEDSTMILASDSEKELARAKKVMGVAWVQEMKKKFLERAKLSRLDFEDQAAEADETCPTCNEVLINNTGRVLACGHEACFDCLMELSSAPPVHDGIFGHGDEADNIRVEKEFEAAVAKGLRPCPTCRKMNDFRSTHTFKSSAFQPTEEEFAEATRRKRPTQSRQSVGKLNGAASSSSSKTLQKPMNKLDLDDLSDLSDSDDDLPDISQVLRMQKDAESKPKKIVKPMKAIISDDESDSEMLDITIAKHKNKAKANGGIAQPTEAVYSTWRKGDNDMEPSAKMLQLIKYLKEWEPTGDKTIVYSQWTSMLDLVETIFARYGIQSLRYDGKMNREAREAVLARFRKSGGPRVILISTKCGGVGLNLVSANRVINMDLSWNFASESQAYDRVHRLGQEKDVFIKRIVVRNTIEDRMLQLQETKTGLAEAALGEGGGIKLHKLSVKQLRTLFGMSNVPNDPNQTTL
ncbi:SNF2 family DNA-dependent ATPase [Cristinia sonorae]|uniref:SNF2 family DNA-dependent ATPase n=1 Tax=Cristinia sonorae TaxID=1940300 RepID=A0A8K0XS84_9AGAR|nr:SNF2 family DNA-dependent ATPase [Cristinia sonorae]